jgi:uncharacterized membrane protein YphA (DoxX/SURF4 family)
MSEDPATVHEAHLAPEPTSRARSRLARWVEQLIPRACGLLFIYAGVMKWWDPTKTHRVFAFDRIPEPLIKPLTMLVASGEIALGLLLVIGLFAMRRVIVATILLLFVYSIQLAVLIAAQNPPECSCAAAAELLNRFKSAKLSLTLGLVRNALMMAALEWVRLRMAGRAMMSAHEAPRDGARIEQGG